MTTFVLCAKLRKPKEKSFLVTFWILSVFFLFILSKKGTKNANIFKVPRSPMEIFKTFIFNYMIVKYTNFQLHKVARLKENHVTSQGYKSQAKSKELDISLKIEAFLVLVHNISLFHHIAHKIMINFHIKNFFLAFMVFEWRPKQFSVHLLYWKTIFANISSKKYINQTFMRPHFASIDQLVRQELKFFLWNKIRKP